MLWQNWKKEPDDGTTIFLQDYKERGENNRKKKAYFSALTPDLYVEKYGTKVSKFFNHLLSSANQNLPLLGIYEKDYPDLYWDLHLSVNPEEIPNYAKDIGTAFMTCLALGQPIGIKDAMALYKENYMYVRENRSQLDQWVAEH